MTPGRGWVLVTDDRLGQARAALATVRSVAAAGYRPAVLVASSTSIAAASRHCKRRIPVPRAVVGTPEFKTHVEAELASGEYLTVLPTGDAALLALGAPVEHLVNKVSLAGLAKEAGLVVPPSEEFSSFGEVMDAAAGFDYPVVIKPVTTSAAMRRGTPVRRVDSPAGFREIEVDEGRFLVQPYFGDELWSIAGVLWQERLAASAHQRYLRTWPRDCGGASAAVTMAPHYPTEDRLVALLEGYNGVFQAQFCGPYLLDVNPRVYGSMFLAVRAGANLAGLYCDLLSGTSPGPTVRARSGVHYRWIEGDLRHIGAALRAGHADPRTVLETLRPHRRSAHPESLLDPMPHWSRLRHAVAKRSPS